MLSEFDLLRLVEDLDPPDAKEEDEAFLSVSNPAAATMALYSHTGMVLTSNRFEAAIIFCMRSAISRGESPCVLLPAVTVYVRVCRQYARACGRVSVFVRWGVSKVCDVCPFA